MQAWAIFTLCMYVDLLQKSGLPLNYQQERGKRMALSNLALFGGAFFTPVLVGKITHTIGWEWTFYLIAIFCGALLPFVIFYCPETAYRRDDALNTDISGERDDIPLRELPKEGPVNSPSHSNGHSLDGDDHKELGSVPAKTPYSRTLLPFNGRKTNESFFKLLIRPLPLYLHPAILWATLIQGTLIGWTVMIGVVLAALFLGPPLWFDEVQTGYMYAGPFVGALLGFLLSGLLADWSAKWMTMRNRGVYEPEFRILLVIPQMIFGCAGLYGFGITAAKVTRNGWFWPDFFFALEVMGMVLGAVASALYIVDAHRKCNVALCTLHPDGVTGDIAVEAFTCLLIFKNLFSFGLTFKAYDWLIAGGIERMFNIMGSVQLVICLLSIPMCKFPSTHYYFPMCDNSQCTDVLGKKNRAFFSRHDILKILRLK